MIFELYSLKSRYIDTLPIPKPEAVSLKSSISSKSKSICGFFFLQIAFSISDMCQTVLAVWVCFRLSLMYAWGLLHQFRYCQVSCQSKKQIYTKPIVSMHFSVRVIFHCFGLCRTSFAHPARKKCLKKNTHTNSQNFHVFKSSWTRWEFTPEDAFHLTILQSSLNYA